MHNGKLILKKDNYAVVDCSICGFKHLDPVPSKKELDKYYRDKYYQQGCAKLLDPDKEKEDSEWTKLAYSDTCTILDKYITSDTRRILDIGCGNGFFLDFMKRNGWDVFGIEPSKKAGEYASFLEVEIFNTTLDGFIDQKWNKFFDAINLTYLLEHVPDPVEVLKQCKNLLKDKGLICVEVPNDFNRLQLELSKKGVPPWWVSVPDHINYFNFESLEQLLVSSGFEIVLKTTNFPMELFLIYNKGLNF